MKTIKTVVSWNEAQEEAIADMNGNNVVVYGKNNASPMELLLGSLGGCMVSIMAMLADKKRMAVPGLQVALEGDMDPAGMAKRGRGIRAGFQQIRMKVTADKSVDPEALQQLVQMAGDICPVKDTLQGVQLIEELD